MPGMLFFSSLNHSLAIFNPNTLLQVLQDQQNPNIVTAANQRAAFRMPTAEYHHHRRGMDAQSVWHIYTPEHIYVPGIC